MEKRVVLFLVLSLGIIFAYDYLLKQMGITPFAPTSVLEQELAQPASSGESPVLGNSSPAKNESSIEVSNGVPEAPGTELLEEAVIDTPLLRAGITSQGGVFTFWELKKFLTQTEEPQPVELVYSQGQFPGPLSLHIPGNQNLTDRLQKGAFSIQQDFSKLDADHPTGKVTLTYGTPLSDLWVEKELTFHYDSYLVDIAIRFQGIPEKLELVLGTNFGVVEWGQGFIGLLGSAWMIGEQLEKENPETMGTSLRREGNIKWLALQDKYFISVLIPANNADEIFSTLESERVVTAGMAFPAESGEQVHRVKLYAGPKHYDRLKSLGIGLEDTIDFGWFIYGSWTIVKAVAKPLFSILKFINEYTHNYGVAIILLTFGIKLLFVPLQYKSYKSMQGMQTIQPKVLALQDKFKDNREKLNQELMKLYREHKVNPVGGCLPMVLQMPVFVALFNILYMTIDLRQAPFMLWITDLSVQDPYYVLPVLMGVSMVIQQKIMPTSMDPTQAKMMMILPVGLTFLFVTFPAGLVLYWVTQNILTITQQVVTDRYVLKKPKPGSSVPTPVKDRSTDPGKKKSSSKSNSSPKS
ncbi:MAG: membrane protein insertase YidC [Nitrospirales bacterium]